MLKRMINRDTYRQIMLKMVHHSSFIAVVVILASIYLCFSYDTWLYVVILFMSSIYLGWLTYQYVKADAGSCNDFCNLQYGCQVASFNSRLSTVSNLIVSLMGIAFSAMSARYMVFMDTQQFGIGDTIPADTSAYVIAYLIGFIKLLVIFMLADKIHTSQLITSIMYRYSQSVRFLNVNIDTSKPECRYPVIYLDGKEISPHRYRVTDYAKMVTAVFRPTLSLGDDSEIGYRLIEPDKQHVVNLDPIYDRYDQPSCLFRCHVVVRNLNNLDDTQAKARP